MGEVRINPPSVLLRGFQGTIPWEYPKGGYHWYFHIDVHSQYQINSHRLDFYDLF